jgi:cell division protein FtsI (penicillin-binding protein 3)
MTNSPESRRLRWLLGGALAWTLLITLRVVLLQTRQQEALSAKAENQQEADVPIEAPRGDVLDRDGRILAMSRRTESLGILPRRIRDVEGAITMLAGAVHPPEPAKFSQRIRKAHQGKLKFLAIKRHLPDEEAAAVRAILAADAEKHKKEPSRRINWIDIRPTSKRVYTNGSMAAHVLGSVTLDGNETERGQEGIELKLDRELRGVPGSAHVLKDGNRQQVDTLDIDPARPGKAVALTIATPLQFYMDNRLARAVHDTGSIAGAAVAYDPANGEVLGMSSFPTFDPNVPPRFNPDKTKAKTDPERIRRMNLAISGASESGSVAKLFTFMAALRYTRLQPDSLINCGNGEFELADGRKIHDSHAYWTQPMKNVLALSSNVGTIHIAQDVVRTVGQAKFRGFLFELGFGQRTGIELPDESRGTLREKWKKQSHVHHAIGYEYGSTTLQIARAVGAIANNGVLMRPRIVRWRQARGGEREEQPADAGVRVITASQAVDMRVMAKAVVDDGTGKAAALEAHFAGGKTGTARRYEGGRYQDSYNASFAGFAPLNKPRIVVVVTLYRTAHMAADAAAPVFRDITTAALRYLGVRPDFEPRGGARANTGADEEPAEPEPLREIAAEPEPAGPVKSIGPRVPDLRGKDKRQVAEVAVALGVSVEMVGKGVVVRQSPAAGQVISGGQPLRVQFDR